MIFDFSNRNLYNYCYIPLFHNKTRFLHLFGSAGSGKSVFGGQKEIVLSFKEERRNRKTLVVRKVFNTLKNSVFSQLKSAIYEWNLQDCFQITTSPLSITNKLTNIQFIFVGLDDVEKIKSVQGVDRILIEEATELSTINELDQLSLRLRGFSEIQITLMYNPVNAHHWINTEIHQKAAAGQFIFKSTYQDNRFLDDAYKEFLGSLKESNPNYYKVYGLGEWGQNQEGLIYPDYVTVAALPRVQIYGLDFGFNDPCALVAVCTEDEIGKRKKNLYLQELLYKSKLTSGTLINKLNDLEIKAETKFGEFTDANLTEMIAVKQETVKDIALVSGIPPSYFNLESVGQAISGEALRKIEARFTAIVQDAQRSFGETWAQVVSCALEIERVL